MVDAGHENAVAGSEPVRAVVEQQLDAALEHQIEVDRVGVVHGPLEARLPPDDHPTQTPSHTEVEMLGRTGRAEWRRQLSAHVEAVSYTHLRAHETPEHLVCRLLLE